MADIKMIDKYKIIGVVGEGGMGKVYRAAHPTLKRDIIIKRLSISAKKVISERFRREAQIMMDFHHESIVSVYDHFKHGQSYYIAMEFVDGVALDALIEKKKQVAPLAVALIFREICKGLRYAHDKGVIHRDIKPSNVLIAKTGEVKLFDFGIAMLEEDEDEKDLTRTGIMMGTPSYMSPEQLADSKRVDKRSDIYSMGVLLYQMLTGKRAYPGNFSAETIRKISRGVYEKPRKLVPGLPSFFEKLIRKMMHHKASKRYRDLDAVIHKLDHHLARYKAQDEIHKAIKAFLNELAGKESAFDKIPRSKRARKGLLAVAAVVLIAVGGFAFFIDYTPVPGLFYEQFAARDRGGIEIRVAVPVDYYKKPADVYAEAVLVRAREKTKDTPAVRETFTYRLAPVPGIISFIDSIFNPGKKKTVYLTSSPLYLPSGYYSLDLSVEQEKYNAAFYLNPLSVQKQRPDSPERIKIVTFNLAKPGASDVPVEHVVRDSLTKANITSAVKIYYLYGSAWAEWKYAKGVLPGGRKHRLRYVATGFYTKDIEVQLPNRLELLRLDIDLQKIPGRLVLASDTANLEILIDNNKEFYSGEKEKSFIPLGNTEKGQKSILLDEGDYVLTVKKDEKTVNNYPFSIIADSVIRLSVSYDAAENRINIRQ